ncbi:CRISPR-associated ring nuclease Csm6 [Photobacterium iliopiscarium]|uniref:TIGR02584 family CRISPR-associated protein n=1 Tax=Photobacterium iliopiscarium TaxID=56192 RepID=A0ABX5GSW1_9GAMM|nr:CRISPR-associated ring nuclease Csm6 [Photobacterium iliopiscarium]PSW96633.1 TIGR02584 family CRISPR-associated protein [Photobacterium iliopiscarium]
MKEILISVMGTSPQVLTETLYALFTQGKVFPDEVYVITSENAKQKLVKHLIDDQQLNKLFAEYDMPYIEFNQSHILLMKDGSGEPIFNGKREEDQNYIADSIMKIIASFTQQQDTRIHASIAGGRKSMSFYMGNAMSLLGREQDILSHVFISEEFEFCDQFFFPTKQDNYIEIKKDNHTFNLNTRDAEVILAEIPFVRMRHLIDGNLLQKIDQTSFSKTVASINALNRCGFTLVMNDKAKTLSVNGVDIKLTPKEYSYYLWLSVQPNRHLLADRSFFDNKECAKAFLDHYRNLTNDQRLLKTFGLDTETVDGNFEWDESMLSKISGIPRQIVQEARSTINRKIKMTLPIEAFHKIGIQSKKSEGYATYWLDSDFTIKVEPISQQQVNTGYVQINRLDKLLAH